MRPRILDLYSGAGGAAVGYHRAGFDVVGVDIVDQPRYPFPFCQGDAIGCLELFLETADTIPIAYDAIHASPPCQAYSLTQRLANRDHPDLIGPTRELLEQTGLPYVIENVKGAPLINPVCLEGQMFEGLRTSRPRYFETNWGFEQPMMPPRPPHTKMGRKPRDGEFMHVVGHFSDVEAGMLAMGIDWMTRDELAEAVPPAMTEWIGAALLAHLAQPVAAAAEGGRQ